MKFTVIKDPLPFLIIDDVYNKEERIKIYNELDFLCPKLLDAEKIGSAKDINGRLKSNKGVFLDEVFARREFSDILNVSRKIYSEEVKSELIKCCPTYSIMSNLNYDTTLLSYYDDGGSYFSHSDTAVISSITWFFKEPKNFTGGRFKFTESNIDVEVKNNRSVIFFSSFYHEVSDVNLIYKNVHGSGRFSISQFTSMFPKL